MTGLFTLSIPLFAPDWECEIWQNIKCIKPILDKSVKELGKDGPGKIILDLE